MNISYQRLFNLTVGHTYFKDGFDRFVRLYPTAETEALLKNGKMLFKRLPHGATVLYRTTLDEITPFVQPGNDQRFVFVLKTDQVAGVLNLTNLDESISRKYGAGNILYFTNLPESASTNSANPEIITHTLLDSLRGQLFTCQFSVSGNPATVLFRVTDAAGTPVSAGKDANGNPLPTSLGLSINSENLFTVSVDLRQKPKGRYTLTVLNSTGITTLREEKIYADNALARQNIVGIAELVYETATGHLYGETEEYLLQFQRSGSLWKYVVVNKRANLDFDSDTLSIHDAGTPNGTPYVTNQFSRAYASIQLTANPAGAAGNLITLDYSGGGEFPAVQLSGKTLSGGETGVAASGMITVVNNTVAGYTVSINGTDFTEGTDFSKGATPADTANALRAAINGNGAVPVSASLLNYDIQVNGLPALVFRSTQAIPFFEIPKTDLQLRKSPGNQTIMANLPNPAPAAGIRQIGGSPESEMYIYL
ncbi:MAG: hypothetical protein AB7U05_02725 [Mangrovibacterium sp.]